MSIERQKTLRKHTNYSQLIAFSNLKKGLMSVTLKYQNLKNITQKFSIRRLLKFHNELTKKRFYLKPLHQNTIENLILLEILKKDLELIVEKAFINNNINYQPLISVKTKISIFKNTLKPFN